jgi:hypothetical protein
MQPEAGGRFEAHLIAEERTNARFRVELGTPAGQWSSEARVSRATGEVEWGAWAGPADPPDWLRRYLRSALRSAWRSHAEQGWPRRLTRWRAAPDARRPGDPDESQ